MSPPLLLFSSEFVVTASTNILGLFQIRRLVNSRLHLDPDPVEHAQPHNIQTPQHVRRRPPRTVAQHPHGQKVLSRLAQTFRVPEIGVRVAPMVLFPGLKSLEVVGGGEIHLQRCANLHESVLRIGHELIREVGTREDVFQNGAVRVHPLALSVLAGAGGDVVVALDAPPVLRVARVAVIDLGTRRRRRGSCIKGYKLVDVVYGNSVYPRGIRRAHVAQRGPEVASRRPRDDREDYNESIY